MPDWTVIVAEVVVIWIALSILAAVAWTRIATNLKRRKR